MEAPKKSKIKNNINVYTSSEKKSSGSVMFPLLALLIGSVGGFLWGRHTAKVDENAKGRIGPNRPIISDQEKRKLLINSADNQRVKDVFTRMTNSEINDSYFLLFESKKLPLDNDRIERLKIISLKYGIFN